MQDVQFFQPDYTHLRYGQRKLSYLLWEFDSSDSTMDFDVFLPTKNRNLQRPLVWSKHGMEKYGDKYYHHRKLIESIFAYTDIGKFVIYRKLSNNKNIQTMQVIDGKQRIHAINDFRNNKFGIYRDGIEYFYKDLPKPIALQLFSTTIAYCEIDSRTKELTDEELITLFNNINFGGVPIEYK